MVERYWRRTRQVRIVEAIVCGPGCRDRQSLGGDAKAPSPRPQVGAVTTTPRRPDLSNRPRVLQCPRQNKWRKIVNCLWMPVAQVLL
jgi:hypothetical protein